MLNHPHVVAVFDLVEEDDHQWLVMEYVEGETLAQRMRTEGPLETTTTLPPCWPGRGRPGRRARGRHRPPRREAVQHPRDRDGAAKLTDFGIARSANDASLTRPAW